MTKNFKLATFRTTNESEPKKLLFEELKAGRLRQGWGVPSCMSLRDEAGEIIQKEQWVENYQKHTWGAPSTKRYSALARMLRLEKGDVVIVPKMPEEGFFSIARLSGDYYFDKNSSFKNGDGDPDFGHVVPVDTASVHTFNNCVDKDTATIATLFRLPWTRWPVAIAANDKYADAALKLLGRKSEWKESHSSAELAAMAFHDAQQKALEAAATKMKEEIQGAGWDGYRFERAVKQVFLDHGYQLLDYKKHDGRGGDADMVFAPPKGIHSLFTPRAIAIQVKWKQGTDHDDEYAVEQLVKWTEAKEAYKFVITSADGFTPGCQEWADKAGITLIGGDDTAWFLLGYMNPDADELGLVNPYDESEGESESTA